ncbi:hypothetical protein N431DRAFT_427464 [Stipitochalara longipes BDJ]|nr:hypothetical protein N431DRAFT_427464 [Stipitochalara longipes BDJ]
MPRTFPPFTVRGFLGLPANQVSTQSASVPSPKKYFRLLCVDDLTLQSFEIGSSPPYIAVSHVWADKVFVDRAHFDSSLGGRAVRIALSQRFPAINYCWIDNFCILQDNENDKFEQIPLMGNIYRDAHAVLIIHACELGLTQVELDEATSGVEEVVELWRAGHRPSYDEKYLFWLKGGEGYTRIARAMKTLARFTQSDWCNRVWTLQEFIFARTIVWIGADLMPLTCEDIFFRAIPSFCTLMYLKELSQQSPDAGFNRLHDRFNSMAIMRIAAHDRTRVMEIIADRASSLPVDGVYGAMAASGVQISPLPNETKEEAWMRWCEAAVSKGHIRWLMLPPAASSIFPDAIQGNCPFPSASTRQMVSSAARLDNVVPYGPSFISAGTVTLAAKFAGRCRLLRKLGPLSRRGEQIFPIASLILFSKGDWSLAVHIAESFNCGEYPTNKIHAIATVLVNSYESALRWWNENLVDFTPVISTSFERQAFLAFSNYIIETIIGVLKGAIVYLALLEYEEMQASYVVAVAIGDRVPTGPLVAFDVNAITNEKRTILMVAEAGTEDVKRQKEDPDFDLEDFIFHKAGVTIPISVHIKAPLQQINVGGSRCPVCRSEG